MPPNRLRLVAGELSVEIAPAVGGSVAAHDARSALLGLQPDRRGWPWPYRASQRFELEPDGMRVTLALQNLADEPFPFSLGLHPYFPRPEGALLQASCRRIRSSDGADFGSPRAVAAATLDHCFDGWLGQATVLWPADGLALTLHAEGCGSPCG
jgi:aldose 1-epimerase